MCPECQHHPGQRCEANCQQCSEPACFICYISDPHQEHKVEELSKTHENLKQKIKKHNEEIKAKIIPKYQRKNNEIGSISLTKTQFDDIRTENEKLRKIWHQAVDTIFDQIDSMRQCKSEENLNALHAYLTKIRKMIPEMNETVKLNETF